MVVAGLSAGLGAASAALRRCAGLRALPVRILLLVTAYPFAAVADDCLTDTATRQAVVSFSSVLDGQPGTAGQPFLGMSAVGTEGAGGQFAASYNFTPSARSEVCDALISLSAPTYLSGDGEKRFDPSFGLSWEQRWRADDVDGPTLSSFVSLAIPYEGGRDNFNSTVVLILARSFGEATAYLNLGAASAAGVESRWIGQAVVGWKQPLPLGSAAIADLVWYSDGGQAYELSWQFAIGNALSLGPGLSCLDDDGHALWSYGLVLQYTFAQPAI